MKNFFDKTEYTQEDILALIEEGAEESLNLDFKRAESLEQTDGRKKEISKDVSSFANSDGGIIIYGIDEEGDYKASSLSFVDGEKVTKEWLEQVINSDIHRRIEGIEIYPIRFENDVKKTIYIVKIPASNNTPHMAKDFRYYKRSNFEIVRMHEYEVRQAYQKRENSKMTIGDIIFNEIYCKTHNNKVSEINYILGFQVKNVGNVIEKLYKLEIHLPKRIYSVDNQTNSFYQRLIRDDGNTCVFSIPNYSPIFQKELTTVCSCVINLNYEGFKQLVAQKIKIKLYYTSGLEEKVFDIAHKLTYNDNSLNVDIFDN